ncbi:MAG: YesL family protein [Chloroflexota bacterium]
MIDQKLRDKLTDAYLALIPLISLNIIWFVFTVPLVTAIPAAGALFYSTNRLAHGNGADWRTFFEGFRVCFRRSWGWGILNVIVGAGLLGYFAYFAQNPADWGLWVRAFVIVLAFLWLSLQIYTFPLLIEQEKPSLREALRNSLVILLKRPFYSFAVALLIAVIAVTSSLLLAPAWVFITASLCAYLANGAALAAIVRLLGKASPSSDIEPASVPNKTVKKH